MKTIRIRFEKKGPARFISHLDLSRVMSRAIRRASLNLWYTEGFHTHPYLVFGQPISLGYASACEFMEFRMLDETETNKIQQKLQAQMPPGIQILSCYEPLSKLSEIRFAAYDLLFTADDPNAFSQKLMSLLSMDQIPISKKSKRGETEIDLKLHIYQNRLKFLETGVCFSAVLPCSNDFSVNPILILHALKQHQNIEASDVQISKTEVYRKDFSQFE